MTLSLTRAFNISAGCRRGLRDGTVILITNVLIRNLFRLQQRAGIWVNDRRGSLNIPWEEAIKTTRGIVTLRYSRYAR